MEAVRLLPQPRILQEWWQEVKENFFEEDAKPQVLKLVKQLMESTINEEITVYSGAQWHERTDNRMNYRNGFYERSLITQFGTVDDIEVPRLRYGSFKTCVFRRYKRYQDIVEDLIQDIFLAGVSTRRVGAAISKLLDTKVSHGTVSRITRRLDSKVREFHKRPLIDEYQYLFLDAINLKIRYNLKYRTRKILVAYGITVFGQRHLLDFRQAKGESQNAWETIINNLYERGLKGKNLKLITMDGSKALEAAASLVYPDTPIQLCWAHKLRNVSNYCLKKYQEYCTKQAGKIYRQDNKTQAIIEFRRWKKAWENLCPKAVACLERDLHRLVNFYDCPKEHWIKIRTTNVIERSFREIRRRTRVFSCFSNMASCERIVYAIFTHLNNQWKDKPLKEFTQFC